MIDVGSGFPLVVLPGVQGRWEWLRPGVDALSRKHRVLSFSLGEAAVPGLPPFDAWLQAIDRMLDASAVHAVCLVGHSFGGLVAIRYAATRPERVAGLVLVSSPAPRPRLSRIDRVLVRHPVLALPLFIVRGAIRLAPEVVAARPDWPSRTRLAITHIGSTLRWPASPARMAAWVRAWESTDIESDCAAVRAPVLVVTGDQALDRVVPPAATRQYLSLLADARPAVLPDTGHLGPMAKPDELAALVSDFIRDRTTREETTPAEMAASPTPR